MRHDAGDVDVIEVHSGEGRFEAVMRLAATILEQDRYFIQHRPHARRSHVFGAFIDGAPVGFLRLLIQIIGEDEGRPPVRQDGADLTEGYVEAFGVTPSVRRRGIGQRLQDVAIEHARRAGCFQMRSRSPVTSIENYALKLATGYVLCPSEHNDSYYFMRRL